MTTPPANAGTPISAERAGLWGAFLYEGLMIDTRYPDRPRRILEIWNQGCIELVAEVCSHLPELWRQIEPYWNNPEHSFPGVFEYEVVSDLGTMLGDYLQMNDGQLPSASQVHGMIDVLIRDFLTMTPPPSDNAYHPR